MALPVGAQIFKVHGTITELYGPKSGTNAKGEWILQRGTLQFDDGQKMGLFFKDRDPIHLSAKGRRIELACHSGPKGLSGVYADDDNNGNEVKRQIKVTSTGELSFIDGGGSGPNEHPPQRTQQAPPPQRTQQAPHDPPPQNTQAPPVTGVEALKAGIAEITAHANRVANLQLLAMETVDNYVIPRVQNRTGRVVSDQERASLTMNMIIELMRGMGASKMPARRLAMPGTKPTAPPPQQPPPQTTELAPEEYTF